MKNLFKILVLTLPLFFTSCVVIDNTPGPDGRDGAAFFGVDFEHSAPYSYWDNNRSIPYDPILGDYYYTSPGIFEFEYFINPDDYWYGTYEVWINYGGRGGQHGEPGYDGLDTYLMLIADPGGYHFHEDGYRLNNEGPLVVEKKEGKYNYRITIQKGNRNTRKAQEPKFVSK